MTDAIAPLSEPERVELIANAFQAWDAQRQGPRQAVIADIRALAASREFQF